MQKGDVILVDYTGRDLTTNRVFDTTVEQDAKAADVYNAQIIYKPVPIVLGRHEMLAGLEDE
ncbi:MAG: peptidylprolyl isomerase, partial [Candidatus Diapherotrites archaeon]|nr:peptidylprolyl isomerase [Candidatus Diapherotrites archaeon]